MTQGPEQNTLTVLAVDDEPANNDLVRRTLRLRSNYRVLFAASGKEALGLVAKETVDVVLVDQSMPGMSGIDFLNAAKSKLSGVVAIAVTGYPELDDVVNAMKKGIVAQVVVKPWTPNDLLSAIDRAAAVRDMNRAVARMATKVPQK